MSFLFSAGAIDVIPDSAVNQWKYAEGSGTTVADSIGSVTGSTTGGVTWVSDTNAVGDYRLSLDGTDDRVEFSKNIDQYSEVMIAFTLDDTTTAPTNDDAIIGWEQADGFGEVRISDGGSVDEWGWNVGDGSTQVFADPTTDVFDGNKHRISVWINEGTEIGIAVDGTVEDTTSFGTTGNISNTHYVGYQERQDAYVALDIDNEIIYTDSSDATIQQDYDSQPWV